MDAYHCMYEAIVSVWVVVLAGF